MQRIRLLLQPLLGKYLSEIVIEYLVSPVYLTDLEQVTSDLKYESWSDDRFRAYKRDGKIYWTREESAEDEADRREHECRMATGRA